MDTNTIRNWSISDIEWDVDEAYVENVLLFSMLLSKCW